jgi:hypothetical protein
MNIRSITLIALLTPACDTEPTEVSLRSELWDEITCMSGARCFGHRVTADELWSPLISECDLDGRVANGWIETSDGYTWECDLDGTPQTFPDVRCFYVSFTMIKCFGGDDGWYTEVGPSCVTGNYTSSVWMTGSCDPDTYMGWHDYDWVFASPKAPDARVFDGADYFQVVP